MAPHPLVQQLHFTRSEFQRAIQDVSEENARTWLTPMNCISWNVGHLAWNEQKSFLTLAQGKLLRPDIAEEFKSGAPATTPVLAEMTAAWQEIKQAADEWLDTLTTEMMLATAMIDGKPSDQIIGSLLQRVIYHYWYHIGEIMSVRQIIGEADLPQFVGRVNDKAPYQAD